MQIADSITIIVDGDEVDLRPSLRCAMRLERSRTGSFQALARELMQGSLTAAVDIVEPHTDFSREYLAECILPQLDALKPVLLSYLAACTGIDPDDKADEAPKGKKAKSAKPVTSAEYLLSLYRIGTGWLGWTPTETLHATPAEISESYTGKIEMLKAIYGSGEDKVKPEDTRPLNEKFRKIFSGHGTIKEDAA